MAALIGLVIAALLLVPSAASASLERNRGTGRTPVIVFPAFHFTKLKITVRNQVAAPECPRSGTFEDWFLNDHPSTTFSQICQDKLLTLRSRLESGEADEQTLPGPAGREGRGR